MLMKPTKTIKVDDATHKRLKLMSAKTGEHVYEVVARLVKPASTNGVRKERAGRREACERYSA